MISIIIAYNTRRPSRSIDPGYMNHAVIGLVIATLALTLIGPLKTFYGHVKNFIRTGREKGDKKVTEA